MALLCLHFISILARFVFKIFPCWHVFFVVVVLALSDNICTIKNILRMLLKIPVASIPITYTMLWNTNYKLLKITNL